VRTRHVLASFEHPQTGLLVHFDVDVIDFDDFPVADVPITPDSRSSRLSSLSACSSRAPISAD